jgi:hypothetical protein
LAQCPLPWGTVPHLSNVACWFLALTQVVAWLVDLLL